MANLSPHLLRYDDVVSANGDWMLLKDQHVFTSRWLHDFNHLSSIILMNIKDTINVISNSNSWEGIYNRLVNDLSDSHTMQKTTWPWNRLACIWKYQTPIEYYPAQMTGDCVMHHSIYSELRCLKYCLHSSSKPFQMKPISELIR